MRPIRVVPVGPMEPPLLEAVASGLAREYRTQAAVSRSGIDPSFAHHPQRNQYHSTLIIEHLSKKNANGDIVIGVTSLDLFIPILTFVFGEAQLGGTCAVVSAHRLTQEFYGLPRDPQLVTERLVKEAIHEVGHTAGLTHCEDYDCVMAASHAVEWLDTKTSMLCAECRRMASV